MAILVAKYIHAVDGKHSLVDQITILTTALALGYPRLWIADTRGGCVRPVDKMDRCDSGSIESLGPAK